jgi:phenylalanyl-tRNA synthetase beta chain
LGYLGEVSEPGLKQFGLRTPATVAEIRISQLMAVACLIPQHVRQLPYPAIDRDLNLVVDQSLRWAEIEATAAGAAGEFLERLQYVDTYRDAKDPQLGPTKKSFLMTIRLRSKEGTLTGEQADALREKIVEACAKAHGAELRA